MIRRRASSLLFAPTIMSLSLLLGSACGDDDDGAAGAGGGGSSGSGGGAGSAGGAASGAAGAAGGAGAAGAAGQGGAGTKTALQVVSGVAHSCALIGGGEARCWGFNLHGELGDGTTDDRLAPVPVVQSPGGPPLAGIRALASGSYHTCALLEVGEVRCWGLNGARELGNGMASSGGPTPVPVVQSPGGPPLAGVRALESGERHTCALLDSGEARCWGHNGFGQLGDGSVDLRDAPVPVLASPGGPPLGGIQALAAGGTHSCALLAAGEVRCWGSADVGPSSATPVPVLLAPGGQALSGVRAIAAGSRHDCALLDSGEARCWGRNSGGELGNGAISGAPLYPVPVVGPGGQPLGGIQSIALGLTHGCVALAGGEARCWGDNSYGQLGDGTTESRPAAVPLLASVGGPPLVGVQSFGLGFNHGCLVLSGGQARCWGVGGSLGDGTRDAHPTPVPVALP